MNEHSSVVVEIAAMLVPILIGIFVGIIAIYSRVTKIETKLEPIWEWWNNNIDDRRSRPRTRNSES